VARSRLLTLYFLLAALGCGGVPKEKLDQAQKAVEAALSAWKRGERPAGLTQDALATGQSLLEYEILRTEADRQGVIRTFVKITLKDRKGRQTTRQVGYVVDLTPTLQISDDPFS
jgi:hypothetical protein